MRVGVVDIGTNSTRLLVADVDGTGVTELDRRSEVTRLGQGVDRTGALADEAMGRVLTVLDDYHEAIVAARCDATVAVLTSAVRDASNGAAFTEEVRRRYGLDARTIPGDEEARLMFLGATAERRDPPERRIVVIDIGGGSTEFVVGAGGAVAFHVSTQAGVVRQTERHLHADPTDPDELRALREEVRGIIAAAVPEDVRASVDGAVAVAGTATSCAAMDQDLEPYDPDRVHGYVLRRAALDALLDRLSAMTVHERRNVKGLHPDRAPTIVAGVAILAEALDAFGVDRVEVSEHDILWGAALARAGE